MVVISIFTGVSYIIGGMVVISIFTGVSYIIGGVVVMSIFTGVSYVTIGGLVVVPFILIGVSYSVGFQMFVVYIGVSVGSGIVGVIFIGVS